MHENTWGKTWQIWRAYIQSRAEGEAAYVQGGLYSGCWLAYIFEGHVLNVSHFNFPHKKNQQINTFAEFTQNILRFIKGITPIKERG